MTTYKFNKEKKILTKLCKGECYNLLELWAEKYDCQLKFKVYKWEI